MLGFRMIYITDMRGGEDFVHFIKPTGKLLQRKF